MKILKICSATIAGIILLTGCHKDCCTGKPHLVFKFVFDSMQVRLNNIGQPDILPANHGGQNPQMNAMSAHYLELTPNATTALGSGAVLYSTPMTTAGGASAINFQDETLTPNNGTFYSVALDSVTPGTYQYLRVSLAYQNAGIQLYIDTSVSYQSYSIPIQQEFPCTLAGFIGVNSYVTNYKVKTESISPDSNCAQGYWGFECTGTYSAYSFSFPYNILESGEGPRGATTVVNPLFATSPIPAGSCVVTGQFVNTSGALTTLTITGHETKDIVVTVSLSTNHSFEWVEVVKDGKWEPLIGENIVNMGIRGLMPIVTP